MANRPASPVRVRAWLLGCAVALLAACAGIRTTAPARTGSAEPALRLVLAIDGIPFDLFAELQQRGHFAGFRPAARMVSTFPSLTGVAFAIITGKPAPRGYQFTRYDPARNRVVGNTLGELSEREHPKLRSDSPMPSMLHRAVGYVAAYRVAVHDLEQIGEQVLRSDKATYVGYIGTSDAVLHVQGRRGAEKFLLELDDFLARLRARVRERTGRELLVDIVSDHGSTLLAGDAAPLERTLDGCGFRRSDRLLASSDVAYPLPGIVGSVAVSVPAAQRERVALCLAGARGVELVAVDRGPAVGVLDASGEAEVRLVAVHPETYEYRTLRGDPLGLLGGAAPRSALFEQSALFRATLDDPRPSPLRRLWRAFHGSVQEPTPILLSLADGYEAGNPALRMLAQLRGRAGTHGSMTRMASLGVVASNWREVRDVDAWDAHELLFGPDTVQAVARRATRPAAAQVGSRSHPPP